MLLEAGADVETPDNYGQTPFFMACWKGLSKTFVIYHVLQFSLSLYALPTIYTQQSDSSVISAVVKLYVCFEG